MYNLVINIICNAWITDVVRNIKLVNIIYI